MTTNNFKVKPKARHVPSRCGTPFERTKNRPSVEYTGHGNTLIYDGWGGRIFRASEEWVHKGCEAFIHKYTDDGGDWVNYNDLYAQWGIEQTDFGAKFGYSPSEDWRQDLEFTFTWLDSGELVDKFGEKILLVEPVLGAFPCESYWEV
jgi:hypothetical protein